MKKSRLAVFGLFTVAATLALTACSNGSSSSSDSEKQVWRRMESDIISSMDSSTNTDAIAGQALVDTMDGLYRYKGDKLEAAVAKEIAEPSKDGLSYTFELKKTKWSNGDPVTAKDFVYAWKRAVDPKTKSQYAYLFSGVANADDIMAGKKDPDTLGVEADGDYTLKVTLDRPVPYFGTMLVNPVFFPLNEKFVEKQGDKYGTQSKYLIFNGPFKLTKWNGTNNKWVEVKNKTYWNAKKVKLDEIQVQVIKDPDTALSLFQNGDIDDVAISGETAAQMKNDASYVGQKQSTVSYIALNQQDVPALKNKKIRQAISYAINRKELVKDVLGDGSIVASSIVPEGLAANQKTGEDFTKETAAKDKYSKFDAAKAKELWEAGLKEVGVDSIELELLGDDTDGAKKLQEYIQSSLEKNLPGLKVNIQSVPFKTRLSRSETQQFDMVVSLWGADFPDPITFLDLFTSDNLYNDGRWSNAEYDKLIEESKTTNATDTAARWQNLLDASDVLAEEVGIVPVYQRVQAHLVNQKVKNLYYSPANNYNFVGTYLK